MDNQEAIALVEKVALHGAGLYVAEFRTSENLEERKITGLGVMVAKWAKWDGWIILEAFQAALEDANSPDLDAITAVIEAAKKRDMEEAVKELNRTVNALMVETADNCIIYPDCFHLNGEEIIVEGHLAGRGVAPGRGSIIEHTLTEHDEIKKLVGASV